ncbi:hypothetical protein HNQ50_001620 [Silvimonas terrae]|uniref:Uncharacterized protein n=1 Tax=Silvimonas terrae TaxID=300266 RepID=A0A840RD49_9NEIS|nr:hypothetical protein [Silvimonas terrae]MBB5190897.1 hypothetical protein [Silvimonas terrae]
MALSLFKLLPLSLVAGALLAGPVLAEDVAPGLLPGIHKHVLQTSTVPDNGDQNPYALIIAPVSAGPIQQGDVLYDNFNNAANLQGTGTTIVDFNPTSKKLTTIANLSHELPGCPGGVGLSTAMTMLKSGWIIVGSTPSNDGTTRTKGAGCLIVLNPQGKVAKVLADANINDPWGNMAVKDDGDKATLYVSMAGFGVGSPDGEPPVFNQSTILRINLDIPEGKVPEVTSETVVAGGFGEQADKSVFLVGPTGLALGEGDKLYASDALGNRISEIRDASTRTTSAGVGRTVTKDGLLSRPLAMVMTAEGHLLVTNGLNGKVVEVDPVSGKQLYAQWIDADKAQVPPGNGDLFGIVMHPNGKSFYYVEDDVNTIVLAQ